MAKKKKGPRQILGLICQECKSFNYVSERNRTNTEKKLVLRKYCKRCRKHTEHKETSKLK